MDLESGHGLQAFLYCFCGWPFLYYHVLEYIRLCKEKVKEKVRVLSKAHECQSWLYRGWPIFLGRVLEWAEDILNAGSLKKRRGWTSSQFFESLSFNFSTSNEAYFELKSRHKCMFNLNLCHQEVENINLLCFLLECIVLYCVNIHRFGCHLTSRVIVLPACKALRTKLKHTLKNSRHYLNLIKYGNEG